MRELTQRKCIYSEGKKWECNKRQIEEVMTDVFEMADVFVWRFLRG